MAASTPTATATGQSYNVSPMYQPGSVGNGGANATTPISSQNAGFALPTYQNTTLDNTGMAITNPANRTPSTAPTLNTTFPPSATGNITAPAVHTSQPAEDNINDMTNAVSSTNNDISANSNYQATTAANAQANAAANNTTPTTGTSDTSGSSGDTDLASEINTILNGLGTAEGETAQPTDEQSQELNDAESMESGDQSLIAPGSALSTTIASLGSVIQAGSALSSIQNGSVPLTPGEQTQMNDVSIGYAQALQSAQTYAQNLAGGTTAAQGETEQFSPAIALSNIHSAIITGQDKVSAINSKISSSLNKVANDIVNGDYKDANDTYNSISKDITTRVNEIDKISTAIQDNTKQMHADALSVAKEQISALTSQATQDQNAYYKAQNLILSQTRLSDTERQDAFNDLQKANTARTASERAAQSLATFAQAFVPGATMADGTPTVDENGYITPTAWKAAIKDAPAEGLTAAQFIQNFGSQIYNDPKTGYSAYGLTPAQVKLITGVLGQ